MSDEIFFDGVRYVSAADAAADSGFTRDYVARLCRDGKVKGKRVGKNWYVDKSSLTGFVLSQEHAKGLRRESLAETRSKEYQKLHEIRNPAPREFAAPALHPVLDIRRNAHTNASRQPVRTIDDVVPPHASTTPAVTQHVRLMRQKLGTVASRHHAAVAGASRVLSSHAGLTDATIRAAHIPVYTVTPFAEFMHKLVALTLACMMTFGTYALVDPQYARFALESAAGTVRGISDTYETATHGGIGNLSDATQASIKVVVENPKASLASAASVFPHALASLAQLVNAKVDRMVYAVAFPEDLIQRGLNTAGASSGQGRVAVTIQPYLSRGGGTGSGPVTEHASSSEIANGPSGTTTIVNNPVTERIVERIVQTPTVAQAGGITEEYLDSRLNDLESRLSSRVYASASANSTAISQNYNVISQTNAVNNLDHATIQNSSITGGSISGASVAATALSVSGDSNLHGTSVSGDLTVSGAISLSGATSSITADGAVFTNATTTNATTTNFAATGLSSLATTTFTGDITLGGSLLFSGSSSTISAIGATFTNATSTNFFATNASTTNATSTNLFATNASTTNATSTNLFSTIGRFASAFIDSLTSYQSVTAPSFSATSTTATSTFAGGLLATRAPTVPHTFASWAIGAADANPFDASFVINPASAAGDSNLLAAAVGGSVKFLVDAEGDVFVNNLTSVGSVTLSTTTASSFTVEGDAVFGDSISDVTTVNGSLVVTGTTTASTIQGNFGIGTTTPWGRLSIAGAAGGTAPLLAISSSTSAYATSTVFYIDSNGWVGVGTTTPSAKFAVDAPIYIGGQGAAATSTIEGNLHIYGLLKVGTSSSYVSNSNISTIGDLSVTGTTNLSGLLTLATASTSQLSVYNKAYFGATATSTFDSAGNLSVAGTLSLPTLTQGSIPFIGASGVVSEDNDRLFFDSSLHSLRLGGASHTLTGANAAIIGGYFNTASGQYTFIGGGQNNQAQNVYDAVIGGNSNNVNAGNSFIAGGTNNTLTGASAGIVGGYYNTASGQYTFLGGGQNNQASDVYAAIVGGASNQATHGYSFIGGGYSNTANAAYALLGGGQQNTVNGDSSAIAGGYGNTANGLYSFLGGGQNNQTNDVYDAVVGGNTNVANGGNAFIGAGTNNTATGDKSGTLAGYFSTASGETSVVLGGQAGTASGVQSAVLGGYNGRASGVSSIVLGGSNNSATNTSAVALGNASNAGGVNSFASGDTNSAYAQDSFIAGGWNNIVIGDFGFLAGGVNNIVSGDSAAILGGINNLASGNYTSIIGGNTNNATNTNAVVLGGTSNNAGGISAIAGGSGNSAFGDYSFAFGRNTTVNGLGSVGFGLDSGTYAVNNNNVFAILGGNLGVGTTSPLAKLSVAGDTYLGGNVTATGTVTTALGAGAVFSNASGVLSAGTLSILNGGTNATSQTTNGVNYFDGTKITSGSTFTFNGTDIGIPGNIVSSASSLATYGFSNTAGSGVFGGFTGSTIVGSYLQLFGNTGGSGTTPAGGGEFVIDARNGATKFNILSYNGSYDSIFTLTSAGKVGIGNNLSPTYNLDVIGNGKFSSLVDADHFVATSSSVASIFNGGFLSSASSTLGNGTQTGGLTVNGGATTTGNAYFAGIIGVGTKAPQTALDVVGNAYVRNATGIVGSNDGVEIATDSSAPRVSLVQGGRYVGLFSGDAPGNTYLKNVAGGALEFFGGSGGNQELARLTNDGNLGIGTTSPWKMLSVAGDIIGTNLTATGTLQVAGAATLSSTLNVTGNTTLANATTTSIFSTTASSTNLYSTNANLGVLSAGTLSLVSTLNVTGLSTLAGFISTASSTIGDGTQTGGLTVSGGATTTAAQYIGGGLTVNSSASSYFRGTGDLYVGNGALWTGLGGAPDLSVEGYINTDAGINTAGDVKIGHDATLWTALGGYADLAVAGWINANSGVNTAQGSASSPGFNFYSTNNTGIFATAANASAGIGFSTQGVERARIDNAGNLGIGTTTPWGKLAISLNGGDTNINAFSIASSTAAYATSTLFVVNNTGNVGIGTASPKSPLQINTIATAFGVGGNGPNFYTNAYYSSGWKYLTTNPATIFAMNDNSNAGDFGVYTAPSGTADAAITWTNRLMVLNTGNVGIGSTTPAATLSVAGNTYLTGGLGVGLYNTSANTVDLASGGSYKIAGTSVLNGSTLGSGVTGSSLTSVGTITSGTWNGTAIGAIYGGTGQTSVTTGDLLYGSASNTWGKLAGVATGNVLLSGGVGTAPAWGKVSLTAAVSGTLPIANGGTNATSQTTNGVNYFNGTSVTSGTGLTFDGTSLGIGTTTPSAKLTAYGDIFAEGSNRYLSFGTVQGTSGYGFRDNGGTLQIKNSGGSWADIPTSVTGTTGSVGQLPYFSATDTMSATSSIYLATSGNVGIGTVSPLQKLQVAGTGPILVSASTTDVTTTSLGGFQGASDSSSFSFVSHGSARTLTRYGITLGGWDEILALNNTGTNNGIVMGTQSAVPIVFGTNNLERVRIDGSGNIGIGTASPGAKLDVQGGSFWLGDRGDSFGSMMRLIGGSSKWDIYNQANNGMFRIYQANNAAGSTINTDRFVIDQTGNVGIGTTTPWANLSVTSAAQQSGATALFGVASTTGASLFTVLGSGNVGIGVTPTTGLLEVGTRLAVHSSQGIYVNNEVNGGTIATPGDLYLGYRGSGMLDLRAGAMRITPTGNVGIGTTSPTAKLHLVQSSQAAAGSLFIQKSDTSQGWSNWMDSANALNWAFGSANSLPSTGLVTVASGGNVGVGTTTPYRKLSVKDTVAAAQLSVAYDDTRDTQLQTDSSGDFVVNPSGNDVRINDDNLWVCTGGACPTGTPAGNGNLVVESKLAIGTNTVAPTATLTVGGGTGNLTATPMIQINAPDDSSNPGLAIRQNNNDAYGFNFALDNAVNGDMYLQGVANNTVTNLMTFSRNNTNIGIGTTTPAAQLGVGGLLFVGANGATGMGTATSTFYGDIKINGKLDVSTIDPVYTIDGTKYATYGHSTIGIHEETLQTIQLDHKDADGKYSYTISFDDQPMGSDTWLFNQVTDFGDSWKNLVVSLTPSFDGKVFYKKIPEKHQLVIYGDEPGEVSMRLSGSRYDASKWMNLRPDQDGVKEGSHVISSKPAALPAAAASALPQE